MLRRSALQLYSPMPHYQRHNRRVSANFSRPSFLQAHTGRAWYDLTANRQKQIDKKATKLPPLTRTLSALSNERKTGMTHLATMNANYGKSYRNAKIYVQQALHPKSKDQFEYNAPWLSRRSRHEKKQLSSKSAHAIEITGSDDHIVNAGDSLDRAAFDLAQMTDSRWPLVQNIVFESFEWWKEMDTVQNISMNTNKDDRRDAPDCESTTSSSFVFPLDDEKIEKRLNKISPPQIKAMKHRTFSATLQGYTCCLGNFRSIPMELALLTGFADNIAGLATSLREDVATSATSSRLYGLLLQVLFIGILRHQSVSDYRSLGISQIGKFSQHPVGVEKMPNLVSLAMKKFLVTKQKSKVTNVRSIRNRDVDGAIRLGYATCVYCSPNSSNHRDAAAAVGNESENSSSSSFGISSIPINCTVRDSHQTLPNHLLESHFPYSRPFMTLYYCWGFDHSMCSDIQSIKCAAWLFEMSTIALVSLVDCPVPCGVKMRVLRAIQLVSKSCERWIALISKRSNSIISDSEKWSSASILISIKKLEPVLNMLSVVEEHQEEDSDDQTLQLLEDGTTKQLEDGNIVALANDDLAIQKTSSEDGNNKTSDHNDEEASQNSTSKNNKHQQESFYVAKRNPLSASRGRLHKLRPTSYSASVVGVPESASSSSSSSNQQNNSSSENNDENEEYYAASIFAKTMRRATQECLVQIAPYFEVELEEKKKGHDHKNTNAIDDGYDDAGLKNTEETETEEKVSPAFSSSSSSSVRFNVPRSVIAEVADVCDFIVQHPVFDDTNDDDGDDSSKKTMMKTRKQQMTEGTVLIRKKYEKLSEAMQEIVLS